MNHGEKIWQVGRGFCMGCADVIPGVSGGTVALILGIYEELVESIRLFDVEFMRGLLRGRFWKALFDAIFHGKEDIPLPEGRRARAVVFIGFLVLGIAVAIATGAAVITYCRTTFPAQTRAFFMGLVLASLAVPYRRMGRKGSAQWTVFALVSVGTFVLLGLGSVSREPALWYVFLCGAVAICAMILPGISGAFILLMLGMYDYVLESLKAVLYQRQLEHALPLVVFVGGIVVGIVSFSRLLNYLLKNYHDVTMAGLLGLMLGSLRVLWPFKEEVTGDKVREEFMPNVFPPSLSHEVIGAIVMFILGVAIVVALDRVGRGRAARIARRTEQEGYAP